MNSELIAAAIAGVYERSAQLVKASGDSNTRKWVVSEASRAAAEILTLEDASASQSVERMGDE